MDQNISSYDYVIIDPASTEFNRGSFCYLPYILYNSLKEKGFSVELVENFTTAEIDNIPTAKKQYLVALWSYPQIECCFVLNRFLEEVTFFGYNPLIVSLNLPHMVVSDHDIWEGIISYPEYYKDFEYLLLSDCDMHLKKYEGTVYPLFTSYGCPKNCSFCPSSVNCERKRIELGPATVCDMLKHCREQSIYNIHFTDEDFFFNTDRAYNILKEQKGRNMNFIALGSVKSVQKFVDKYGEFVLVAAGMKIIEVGFETGDTELSKTMNKPSVDDYQRLADTLKQVDIFWLTLTFFPGETIKTLNNTGLFLHKYGKKLDEVYGRIATNGTEGGLGQFFQLYDGVKDYNLIAQSGEILTSRPMRLIPSFIPNSFKESIVCSVQITPDNQKWFDLYLKKSYSPPVLEKGKSVADHCICTDDYVYMAICARLGIIT